MPSRASGEKRNARHSILDLAPLELDCLNVLWPMGEGTVRDIRDALADRRPRAYTTIMTIMDRMAQKGIVSRRKEGRAWLYMANVSAGEARETAVRRLVEYFFAGSAQGLLAHLRGESAAEPTDVAPLPAAGTALPRQASKRAVVAEELPTPTARRMDDSLL